MANRSTTGDKDLKLQASRRQNVSSTRMGISVRILIFQLLFFAEIELSSRPDSGGMNEPPQGKSIDALQDSATGIRRELVHMC